MTIEEAIELLDHKTQAESIKKAGGGWRGVAAMNKALEMAIDALRAQQTPLDRSRWDGCWYCRTLNCNALEFNYCPECGIPITEGSWAELERRINGGKTD